MDNLDDVETNAKVSDSAYSNSCSNSQSRRSHSSKSTHSGSHSHSSGSSGYGGKPSTSGSSTNNLGQQTDKRSKDKDSKKKKTTTYLETTVEVKNESNVANTEVVPESQSLTEAKVEAMPPKSPALAQTAEADKNMDTSVGGRINSKDETNLVMTNPANSSANLVFCPRTNPNSCTTPYFCDGFSCVISMHDGVVIYTTSSLTTSLGFPKQLWIGRSFIDFVHPRDRSTFASQITRGLAVPKNGMQEKAPAVGNSVSAMVCRIRKYRGLAGSFGVKERSVTFVPFLLKLSFKNITDEEGKVTYLVIQATQFTSAFKVPNEIITNAVPFVIRHSANGNLEYIDPEAVPYLGYLPQDLADQDALNLYHSDDLTYLRQVYETIVKEGGVARSNPYRLLTQNGDYLKVETEWSSFVNPWSKKLEFVIGKHHVVEGPTTPDVFRAPKTLAPVSEEEKTKVLEFRDTIVRIMNEVLTKPAEAAKNHMSKRCQDVASFMESLIEEEETLPKTERELRLDIHDPDQSYYERDSVMLGGISPHHDYNDSKSSTETPLSYTQLNYNDNLQRYFDSHQPFSYEDYHTVTGENILGLKDLKPIGPRACISPVAQQSAVDSGEQSLCESTGMTGSASSAGTGAGAAAASASDIQALRLTETLLNKHNAEMEKELMQIHRVNRCSSKGEREKASETRQKKKEHLARCNTPFHVSHGLLASETQAVHGVKRASKPPEVEGISRKHHCPTQRHSRRRQPPAEPGAMTSTLATTDAQTPSSSSNWPSNDADRMNGFLLGFGYPHPKQMSIMTPVPSMPGIFPLYYAPGPMHRGMSTDPISTPEISTTQNSQQFHQPMMQCVMYGGAICGSPFMYSAVSHPPQQPYSLQENLMAQTLQFSNSLHYRNNQTRSSKLTTASKSNPPLKMKQNNILRDKMRKEATASTSASVKDIDSSESLPQINVMDQDTGEKQSSTQEVSENSDNVLSSKTFKKKSSDVPSSQNMFRLPKTGRGDETVDKTDGESSYSSFYSSFFKTDSGSAEESVDLKKRGQVDKPQNPTENTLRTPQPVKKILRRKMDPPWTEQVCVTSELIYKYQIITKSLEEVLTADKQKISNMEQPSLVNEQLDQLYLDLQLEGVASRLTLEEGITSSSSSGEESTNNKDKTVRRKREYSKLVMVYEEDAPLPPASSEEDAAEDEPVFS